MVCELVFSQVGDFFGKGVGEGGFGADFGVKGPDFPPLGRYFAGSGSGELVL